MPSRNEIAERVTSAIIASLENGVKPWAKPWGSVLPFNAVSNKPYRGMNILLLGMTEYADPRWITFKQAIDLVEKKYKGGAIPSIMDKGTTSTEIVFWSFFDKTKNEGDDIKSRGAFLKSYRVFNVEQTHLVALGCLPKYEGKQTIESDVNAERIIDGYTNAPRVIHNNSDKACYSPSLDLITMPHRNTFDSTSAYYTVMFHEEIHGSGAKHRLNREGIVDATYFGSEKYAYEELAAEIGAAILAMHAGLDPRTDANAAYIGFWLKALHNDAQLIMKASSVAQKAVDYILGTEFNSD